ncbi:hypothetical protein LguiB_027045 [Lonicera macranthoides]
MYEAKLPPLATKATYFTSNCTRSSIPSYLNFFLQSTTMPSNSTFNENRWVIQISKNLEKELEDDTQNPVNIFNVPKTLMALDPDIYVPQQIAFGPYHCFRPELFDMETYKIAAAKRTQRNLLTLTFQQLVDQFLDHEPRIRSCYHKYLNYSGQTLSWMMALDASFLLEFLQVYAVKEGGLLRRSVTSRMSHLVDISGKNSIHNAILRDIVKLENQIPLFLLRKMLEFQFSTLELADYMLLSMLMGFYKEISPFKLKQDLPNFQVATVDHVLGFSYQMIVPRLQSPDIMEVEDQIFEEGEETLEDLSYRKQFLKETCKFLWKMNKGPVRSFKKLIAKPIKVAVKLPWKIISNVPGIKIFKQPLELCFSQDKEDVKPEDGGSSSRNNIDRPPLVEEISIPSVTELSKAGVCFLPANGDISTISFEPKKCAMYLPLISLDLNSEVVLRNLVAYEACYASGPLVFSRYTELMNGIIDTSEDAELLREKGIISNHLKSDEEVANLWNGMNKCIRLTKVPCLDKVIEDVNKYYNGRWHVKIKKFMKYYVYGSWQFLTLLAAVFRSLGIDNFASVLLCLYVFSFIL